MPLHEIEPMVPVVPTDTADGGEASLASRPSSAGHAADGGRRTRDDRQEVRRPGLRPPQYGLRFSTAFRILHSRECRRPYTTSPRTVRPSRDS
jgi:hypothetical protein